MSGRANLYHVHAAECIKAAQTAHDLEDKQAFLDMATAWLILAEQVDKNSKEQSASSRVVQQHSSHNPTIPNARNRRPLKEPRGRCVSLRLSLPRGIFGGRRVCEPVDGRRAVFPAVAYSQQSGLPVVGACSEAYSPSSAAPNPLPFTSVCVFRRAAEVLHGSRLLCTPRPAIHRRRRKRFPQIPNGGRSSTLWRLLKFP